MVKINVDIDKFVDGILAGDTVELELEAQDS